ncbi:uncharacterized protein B4U79_02426, partial [Dinothrombium tinctorium]
MKHLESANHSTIIQFFNDSINSLFGKLDYNHVLLFVTDEAPYMKLAGRNLTETYTKMIHLTCVAHGCHNIADLIRKKFSRVNTLIFETETNIPLPPEPVMTRW